MVTARFRWLHFSDLHAGLTLGRPLWPAFKTKLLDDLSRQFDKSGPWDAVLFTGDLVQSGVREEYDQLDVMLGEFWARFETLGCAPTLVSIPGNHDLQWPDPIAGETIALKHYWQNEALGQKLLDGKAPAYDAFLAIAFGEYLAWRDRQVTAGRHEAPIAVGRLPGDAAYRLSVGDHEFGVLGLNSAWLQLDADDVRGKLAVDPRQLLALTNEDPDGWCAAHSANFLMTHHPVSWLHESSQKSWPSDIDVNHRFVLHLFGHMHEHDLRTTSSGGGQIRRAAQGSALLGLERLGDGKTHRIQGYSLNHFEIDGTKRQLAVWPRLLQRQTDNDMLLVADTSQGLDDDCSFTLRWGRDESSPVVSAPPLDEVKISLASAPQDIAAELDKIRYFVPDEPAHSKIRRLELHKAIQALEKQRVVWTIADWGMGDDGFLNALQSHFGESGLPTYRFDFGNYRNRDQFLGETRDRFGIPFEELCGNIATVGPCYVLFNEIPIDLDQLAGAMPIERDIEGLAKTLKDFASDVKVVLRAARQPRHEPEFPLVELKALDEADVAFYLRDSRTGGEALAKPDTVSAIHRYTDGIPNHIDVALRELAVTSLEDLVRANTDLGDQAVAVSAPQSVVFAVSGIEKSQDEQERYAFELLKALSSLPGGEQLKRIARLHGPIPFRASHALVLTDRSLVDSTQPPHLAARQDDTTAKTLLVSRAVRDYVRGQMTEGEARSLDRKILELFFGEYWNTGQITGSRAGRSATQSLCDMREIINASTLIVRLLRRAVERGDALELEAGIRLTSAYVKCLVDGSHHRAAVELCSDIIPIIPAEGHERQLTILEYERACSLRMIGKLEDARDSSLKLNLAHLSKSQKQGAKLELALTYQALRNIPDAIQASNEAIAIDRRSNQAIQALSIIAEQGKDAGERVAQLETLRTRSLRKKAHVLGNNIAISMARLAVRQKNLPEATRLFREVLASARANRDFYNGARAIAELGGIHPQDEIFPQEDKLRLIDAYHFAHAERRKALFGLCHQALWKIFEAEGDVENLLSLYRSSSFIWRINSLDSEDSKYLADLRALRDRMIRASADREYFLVRVIVVFGDVGNDPPALTS